jgi:hypothetical protein
VAETIHGVSTVPTHAFDCGVSLRAIHSLASDSSDPEMVPIESKGYVPELSFE